MKEAIEAYRHVSATDEFKEIERLRSRARHNEASALLHARNEGYREAEETVNAKWQDVVSEKDAALSEKDAALSEKDAALSEKDAALSEKDARIAQLLAQLNGKK
jgi:hypothetical protein